MRRRFLLYGANGFSGTLIAERAKAIGLAPVLAGRSVGPLRTLAERLGFEHAVLQLEQRGVLVAALREVDVVLNAAGPFARTAAPLVEACLETSTHYLDISGELPVLDQVAGFGARARTCGIMLMPAVGFVVVPSDCLAAYLVRRMPEARTLRIGVSRTDQVSGGSLKTILAQPSDTVVVRHGGALRTVPAGHLERGFDFGLGPRPSTAVSWGDVVTAYHTTGIPYIEVYLEVSPVERAMFRHGAHFGRWLETARLRPLLEWQVDLWGRPPAAARRTAAGRVIVAEVSDARGRCARASIRTPEAYGFTADTAVAIVERVLAGQLEAGFQTPARVFGADFVLALDGVQRTDLPG